MPLCCVCAAGWPGGTALVVRAGVAEWLTFEPALGGESPKKGGLRGGPWTGEGLGSVQSDSRGLVLCPRATVLPTSWESWWVSARGAALWNALLSV